MEDKTVQQITLPNPNATPEKPSSLLSLYEKNNSGKEVEVFFISLGKPQIIGNVVEVKGFYPSSSKEEDIAKDFRKLVSSVAKEDILEMIFPLSKVNSIRSLNYRAK